MPVRLADDLALVAALKQLLSENKSENSILLNKMNFLKAYDQVAVHGQAREDDECRRLQCRIGADDGSRVGVPFADHLCLEVVEEERAVGGLGSGLHRRARLWASANELLK
jgi:hypothetical protein